MPSLPTRAMVNVSQHRDECDHDECNSVLADELARPPVPRLGRVMTESVVLTTSL